MSRGNDEDELLCITVDTLKDIVGTFDRIFEDIFQESINGMFNIISEGLVDCCNAKFTNRYFDGCNTRLSNNFNLVLFDREDNKIFDT